MGGSNSTGIEQTLIEHWNGQKWKIVSSPSPNPAAGIQSGGGPPFSRLLGVAAVSTNDVWAVGSSFAGSGTIDSLIEHWNGSTWNIVASPNPGSFSNSLSGVAVVKKDDVWAVGSSSSNSGTPQPPLIEHWNGNKWKVITAPIALGADFSSLSGVAALKQDDVWAVGSSSSNSGTPQPPLTEHWNGDRWKVVPAPSLTGSLVNQLSSVSVVKDEDIWAVGFFVDSNSVQQPLIEHWNGDEWKIVPSA